jgi:type I restriction enzyme S subunit
MNERQTVTLNDVVSILGDGLHGTPQYDENGDYFFINGNNLSEGRIVYKADTKRVSYSEYLKYRKKLNERTIFVSINGTIGNIAVYNGEKCILGKSTCYFNVKPEVDKDFIRYVVSTNAFRDYIRRYANGTTIKNVSLKVMRDYPFCLPSLSEQIEIGRTLRALDDKIANNTKINHHLEQMAQAIFKSWFVDFEPFGGKRPDDWREGTISDLGDVIGGSTPSKAKPEYYTEHGIAWITPKDLSANKSKFIAHGADDITELGLRNSSARLMPKGTVLFSSRAPIGYIAVASGEVCTNQGFKSIVSKQNVGTAFIYYFLIENLKTIENMASGSTFKEISGTTMKGIPAVIPDDDTLRRFQKECNPIFEKQELLEAENARLAEIRDTLLSRLMSGELSVAGLGKDLSPLGDK